MGVEKIRARSDNSHLAWGYPPFLGRRTKGRSGVARETRGRRAGASPGVREDGSEGFPRRRGSWRLKGRRKPECAEGCFALARLPALWS